MSDARKRQAWITVGVLLLLLTIVQGIIVSGISTFDARIIAALDTTRGALKFRDFVQILSAGAAGILIGYLANYVPPRRLTELGVALLIPCLYAYSRVTQVWMIYPIHLVLGFCYSSAHVIIVVLVIKQWFPNRQAIPIGIALSGSSLGSAIFPQVVVGLLQVFDWRQAMFALAIFPLLLLPLLLLLLKESGADVSDTPAATSGAATTERPLSRAAFICLAIAAFGIFYSAAAFIFHTFLNLKDQNFSEEAAATGITVIFFTGLSGKFISGFLAEKWGTSATWLAHQVMMLLGALLLTFASIDLVWVALVCLGFGWGGCFSLTQVMIAEQFDGKMLSRLMGWFIAFEGVGSGSGSWLTGVMFDKFGSYRVPFLICDSLVIISIIATVSLRRIRKAGTT